MTSESASSAAAGIRRRWAGTRLDRLFAYERRDTDEDRTANLDNLRRLFWLRNMAIAGQTAAVLAAWAWLRVPIPLAPVGVVIGVLVGINILTWWRLKVGGRVSEWILFGQLMADVLQFTTLLSLTGGAGNPFVSLYLVPLAIAATILPVTATWVLAVITVLCYSTLMLVFEPAPHDHHSMLHDFNLHVVGMWMNFVISAGLVAFFVTAMGRSLRRHQRMLADAREQALRDEQLVALGTLAASTAHELGTPLATMALCVDELGADLDDPPEGVGEQLDLLKAQILRCKEALSVLSASAGSVRADGGGAMPLDGFLESLVAEWRRSRPGVELDSLIEGEKPAPRVMAERTLSQALTNILDNAADVSREDVSFYARWGAGRLTVVISDRGPGLPRQLERRVGKSPLVPRSSGSGLGLGLFLSHGIIERLGGSVTLGERTGGGLETRVDLPLNALGVAT